MRYRFVFIAGLGVGFVLGARAGRERYDQLRRLARKAADSPAVQQAAGAIQAQAMELAKVTKDKLAERVPRMAESARSRMGDALHDHVPGLRTRDASGFSEPNGQGRYAPSPGSPGGPPPGD